MKANGQASHKYLKALAGEMGADVSDLIALSYDNDPYYIGRPSHRELAEWFQGIWRQRGFEGRGGVHLRRVHLRRVHYQLLGAAKHDGRPYENITTDWNYLLKASRYARILGLVNPEDIIDRRNPEPHVYFYRPDDEQEKGFEPHIPGFDLPAPDTDLLSWLEENLKHPHLSPTGYDYDDFSQPYHVEVWVEKSTMNDILQPLCEELSTNLAVGVGYMTITSVVALLRRIEASGKPTRILYVSDFDKAGRNMPKAVARQTEFWSAMYAPDADIRLQPIVLTQDQIDKYDLPSLNIFDDGDEAPDDVVELDALEARVPGELASIVRENIERFRDKELSERFTQAKEGAQKMLDEQLAEHLADDIKRLDELKEEARPTIERYERLLEMLAARLERELEPLQVSLNEVRHAIEESVTALEPPLPDPPQPVATDPDDDGWLFDSSREYMDQLKHYKTPKQWQEMQAAMRSRHKVCAECGTSFVTTRKVRGRRYCDRNCRQRAHRRRQREYHQRKREAKKG
jgi:hypothetical protein